MKEKLNSVSGKIAGASFIAKMNGDEALSILLLEIVKDIQELANDT